MNAQYCLCFSPKFSLNTIPRECKSSPAQPFVFNHFCFHFHAGLKTGVFFMGNI